ncbi:hypothetical protein [Microbacterium capsulatum]|uniref:Uncharacterized protein n=1 Tax=Microbacterium capsulatum TaxID=3041921 RepID=A0ABU0XC44_9MICO|nr:hypothetical protein [Microbacterium sp. ASV81]MDQ4212527.1 hypothetical protein [Microbacterium sp. ASV81]
MTKNPQQLNQQQVDVLRWVRDGCPDGVYTKGWEHRIMARALERRGLVSIGGRGPTWVASITTAGRAWLDSPPTEAEMVPEDSEADRLIVDVIEAGGTLPISAADAEAKPWDKLVRLSLKSPKRPHGKKLTITRVGGWYGKEQQISFTERFEDYVTTTPVPVSERVGKYHPVVKQYLADKHWQYVSKEYLPRAGRILQAVAAEAERRGMGVIEPSKAKKNQGQPQYKRVTGHLWLKTASGEYSIEIKEIPGKGGAKRGYYGDYPKSTPRWINQRQTDFISTGRFELILDGPRTPYQGEHFRDSGSTTVEHKLPGLFARLDTYALEAEWAEKERIREKAGRQRQWEAAMIKARSEYAQAARWVHFTTLAKESEKLRRYRDFLAAATEAASALPSEAQTATADYLSEIRSIIDGRDPMATPSLILPEVSEPTLEQLKPFLGRWSPYGAEA